VKALLDFLLRLLGLSPKPQPPVPAPAPAPKPAPKPALVPKPVIKAPQAWMDWAHREATDGIAEEPNKDNRGPVIQRYIDLAKCGSQGDPYCAIFVNAALEQAGLRGTRSAMARSFESNPNFVKLKGPALGAVATFWRGSKSGGFGHTGFYKGQTANHIYILGANQSDDCNESPFPIDGKSFGLVGFYWPKPLPLPEIKPIMLDGKGRPINLKVT
jgi:uncharacterized protein (TIGR02594 family)